MRLILIDPKMLELSIYEGIPHLLAPVVTDMRRRRNALNWCVAEMERRYKLMSALGVRNLAGYNQKVREGDREEGSRSSTRSRLTPGRTRSRSSRCRCIVVVIDELADLMMVVGQEGRGADRAPRAEVARLRAST